jgi:NADPH:quinone reductase-like Zn-dependent oxidoreductase
MKAAFINKYGGPEEMQYGEIPGPVLKKGEVIIRVKAVSINPVDYKIRQGGLKFISGKKFPKILGHDFSGTVDQLGEGVSGFTIGDKVYGNIAVLFGKTGAMAEFAMVSPGQIRKMPAEMTYDQAAVIPVAALTALNGLRKSGDLKGKRVLVNGATGGVGHFAIQIAKAKGAIVTATCSPKNAELARQLGADEIIDYTRQELSQLTSTFDVILDAFGKTKYATACRLLNKKGVYSSTLFLPTAMVSSFFIKLLFNKSLTAANMRAKPEDYQEIEDLFKAGKVKPLIENTFHLENARDAFNMAENGRPRGKIVLTV